MKTLNSSQERGKNLHKVSNFKLLDIQPLVLCIYVTKKLDKHKIPKNIEEALEIPDWKAVILKEMNAQRKCKTQDVVELPEGKRSAGCKWFSPSSTSRMVIQKGTRHVWLQKLRYFSGMEVAQRKRGFFISQRKYTLDLSNETWMLCSKLVKTPIDTNLNFKDLNRGGDTNGWQEG